MAIQDQRSQTREEDEAITISESHFDIGIFRNGAYLGESPLYVKAAEIGFASGIDGLEWGGNWTTFKDRPHYQSATGLSISEVRQRFEKGQPYI